MKRLMSGIAAWLGVGVLLFGTIAWIEDEKGAVKETDKGKMFYEISIRHEDHAIDVLLTPEGKIVEIEKEIAVRDLPKPVREAIAAKYPNGVVKKAEEKTEGDAVSYEAIVVTTVEVRFDPSGKVLEEEVKGKEAGKKKE